MKKAENISAELLAAFLDGRTDGRESRMVLEALAEDSELREIMRMAQEVDEELGVGERKKVIVKAKTK